MKKSTKGLLIGAGIAMLVGICFTVYGGIKVGKDGVKSFVDGNFNYSLSDFDDDFTLYESLDGSDIDEIQANLGSAAMCVRKSKDDNINIYTDEDYDNKIDVTVDGDCLEIKGQGENKHIKIGFIKNKKSYVILELPDKEFDELSIDADAGAVWVENISVKGECSLTADVGSIEFNDVKAKSFKAECNMGEISGKSIEAKEVDLNCDMGNIDINNIDSKSLDAECDMGNIDLEFVGEYGEYNIDKDCDMGNIDIVKGSSSYEGSKDKSIDLDCGMGNITVKFTK